MASKSKQLRTQTSRAAQHQPDALHQFIRLSREQQQNPLTVLEAFFSNYHLADIRECLWEWLTAALSSDNGTYQTGRARGGLLFLYENMEALAEAAFILHQRKAGGKATTARSNTKKPAVKKLSTKR